MRPMILAAAPSFQAGLRSPNIAGMATKRPSYVMRIE
jgi:hypothetical protein